MNNTTQHNTTQHSIEIYIATHKKDTSVNINGFVPIHTGKAIEPIDLGIIGDDTGDNISEKNKNYCELTALYWIWKNANAEILGLYRDNRYLGINENGTNKFLDTIALSGKLNKENSIAVSYPIYFDNDKTRTMRQQYELSHHLNDWNLVKKIVSQYYPEYITAFEITEQKTSMYAYNMFVGHRSFVNKYCEWLFDILFKLEQRIDISTYDEYQKRVYSFLAERLFNVYLQHHNPELNIVLLPMITTTDVSFYQEKAINIKLYQIFYNEETRKKIDPLCIPLDNMKNSKPEWFEFYPIKNFLDNNELEDNTYYGFLSPRFNEKAKVPIQDIFNLIQSKKNENIDVYLSSLGFDSISYYQNLFLQGEKEHLGITELSQRAFDKMGLFIDLKKLVSSAQTAVFSNYVIAKKEYWLEWKKLADKFYDLVENDQTELGEQLRGLTGYCRGDSPMRTFIQERISSLILANNKFKTYTFGLDWNTDLYNNLPHYPLYQLCEFFKYRYITTNNPTDLITYENIRSLIKR